MSVDLYDVLLLLHVLLFVYWLGADLAVLYSAQFAANPELSIETRVVISQIMGFVDLFPRLSVPLIGAVGASMAMMTGDLALENFGLAAIWVAALIWIAANLYIYANRRTPDRARPWLSFDALWRMAIGSLTALAGILALLDIGVTENRSLALKLIMFAAAVFLSLALRAVFRPFKTALSRLASPGDRSAADTALMQRALSRARPIVLAIWSLTIAAAAIGLWEPL